MKGNWLTATADANMLQSCMMSRVMLAQWADFVILSVIHQHVAIRTKIFVLGDAWTANVEKSHGALLGCAVSMYT
jgi:hypothetical protein